MRTVGLVVHQRLDRQEHAREGMGRVPARPDPRAEDGHADLARPIQIRVEADAALARRQIGTRRVLDRVAVRVLDAEMEEAAVVGRALRAADHAVHRRRHGFSLFGEEVRRVVSSDCCHISGYSLQAPPRRRGRRGGLARAEPVEEGSHLALREAVNMLSGLEPLSGSGDGSPMAAAIKPGQDAVEACLKRNGSLARPRYLVCGRELR